MIVSWAKNRCEFNYDGKITRKDSFRKIVENAPQAPLVRQLRVVVKADDYDAALHFYRDVLGRPVEETYDSEGGAKVTVLVAGGARLVATPRETPWRSLNSRLHAPADLELTLFQELGSIDE